MRSTPETGGVTALPSKTPYSRFAARPGFTLLELLVAVAMVATIFSMVYGSYFAASRSAEACEAIIVLSQDTRKVIDQMARQIRCCYAPASVNATDALSSSTNASKSLPDRDRPLSEQRQLSPKDAICYFHGNQDGMSGQILHLVTTHPISWEGESTNGLFDVTYRFEKIKGQLSFSQERFTGTTRDLVQEGRWQPILTNVESIELAFFDGERWLRKWDYRDKRRLPSAVKIDITCASAVCQPRAYCTVANISCQTNQGKRILSETSVSLKE